MRTFSPRCWILLGLFLMLFVPASRFASGATLKLHDVYISPPGLSVEAVHLKKNEIYVYSPKGLAVVWSPATGPRLPTAAQAFRLRPEQALVVSEDWTQVGMADYSAVKSGKVTFDVIADQPPLGQVEIQGSATFYLGNSNRTVVALRHDVDNPRGSWFTIHHADQRFIPRINMPYYRKLQVAPRGPRIAVNTAKKGFVFDTAGRRRMVLDHARRLSLSPTGKYVARVVEGNVEILEDVNGKAVHRGDIPTQGVAADVSYGGLSDEIVAVVDEFGIHVREISEGLDSFPMSAAWNINPRDKYRYRSARIPWTERQVVGGLFQCEPCKPCDVPGFGWGKILFEKLPGNRLPDWVEIHPPGWNGQAPQLRFLPTENVVAVRSRDTVYALEILDRP